VQVGAISSATDPTAPAPASVKDAATSAFGLGFDALLKIILTQLTYQDPLKPMDNFQFVSQLAQFSQIQIGQTTNERLQSLVTAQANAQASGLLGQKVDIGAGAALITGKVTSITFDNGEPRITITAAGGQTISNIVLSSITQIREGE
jgi:flagellar basal-body rod modification protein FlgD